MSGKIISLTSENVKKISVVQITPEGNLVTIGGANGQGKSSVLDSIEMALGGGEHIPSKPVRRGEDKARIVLELDDIIVRRTFTAAGGTSLTITDKDDVPKRSPQTILDALTGKLSFDPLAFCNQKPPEQFATLQKLMGLDFTKQDEEITKLFDERTGVNREVAALKARGQAAQEYPELKDQEEQSTADIVAEQTKASEQNQANERFRVSFNDLKEQLTDAGDEVVKWVNEVESLERQVANAKKVVEDKKAVMAKLETAVSQNAEKAATLKDIDLAPFSQNVKDAEDRNAKIRANKTRQELRDQYKAKVAEAEKLTASIEALEKQKRAAVQASTFPVPGLSLSDTREVLLDGLPFSQANTAKQLEVSVAVGLAMNTKLKVLLIRRGSDLDPNSLKLIADLAAKADAQVWLETSRTDVPVSVVMEDGHVQGAEEPTKE